MAREASHSNHTDHRFFLEGFQGDLDKEVDLVPISHQLRRVLRLKAGAVITLLDGSGAAFATRIESLEKGRASGIVVGREAVLSEPSVRLTLYQCLPKGDRFEWILQKGTELGVSRFVPVISKRTVVRKKERLLPKYERWTSIVREAAEQSRRGKLPEVLAPLTLEEVLESEFDLGLLAWEEAGKSSIALQRIAPDTAAVSLIVGPEGGITKDEAAAALAKGWQAISLGPRVLRTETAAIAAAAIVMHAAGELG